jgi:hypothetical protein
MTTPHPSRQPLSVPRPRRWSKQEYRKMGELGWFQDQRVELLDGDALTNEET